MAIASKFVIQVGKKHVFNPTNGAIVLMMLVTPAAWLSPGQWGSVAFFAFLMACLGGLVAYRALRSDVALAFIVVYAALMFGRSYYLGEPMTIPMRRLESGGGRLRCGAPVERVVVRRGRAVGQPLTEPTDRVGLHPQQDPSRQGRAAAASAAATQRSDAPGEGDLRAEPRRAGVPAVVALVQSDNERAARFLRAMAPGASHTLSGPELAVTIPVGRPARREPATGRRLQVTEAA